MSSGEILEDLMPSLQPLRFEGKHLTSRWNQLKLDRRYGDEIRPESRIGRLLVVLHDEADWVEREQLLAGVATLPDYDELTVEEMIESSEMEAEMLAQDQTEQRKKLDYANFKKDVICTIVNKFIWDSRPAVAYASGVALFKAITLAGEKAYERVEDNTALTDQEKEEINKAIFATQRFLFMDFDDRWDIRRAQPGKPK